MSNGGSTRANMSEEAFNIICTVCDRVNKTSEAIKYCVECKNYCCQACTDMHKQFSPLFGHSFIDVGQEDQSGNQETTLPEFPTERCCIHKGKIVDMYCQEHDSVGCYACIATDHKSCPDSKIYSVPDMLTVLFKTSESEETESHLKQIISSMSKLSESKTTQLEALCETKESALEQVAKFQNVLECMIRHAADKSRQEIEEAFKNVQVEILQNKDKIEETKNVLLDTDGKLTKATSNRAQRFVRSKLTQKIIKDADILMALQETGTSTDVQITFHPSDVLKDHIQCLHGIGKVQISGRKRVDLYKVIGSQDINIKVSDDTKISRSYGCCLISDQQLLVSDRDNQKLKRVDINTKTVVEHCSLSCNVFGVCKINEKEVAVGCERPNKIQFVSIENKMMLTRKIDTSHCCYGIAVMNDTICVTDWNAFLYLYDMNGTLLRTITNDNDGNKLFANSSLITVNDVGNKLFVANSSNGVVCLDTDGNYQSTFKDDDLDSVASVCSDGRYNVFAGGIYSHNIVQYNEDGKKIGVVVKQNDGLKKPVSIAIHPNDNRLFVTMWKSNVLKVFDLE